MRLMSTRMHGVIDYLEGLLLIAAPWIFGFEQSGLPAQLMIGAGILILLASPMTDYELGLLHAIPMPVHLMLDGALGLLLLVSPWLFGFSEIVWSPHVVFGLFSILSALTTRGVARTRPEITAGRTAHP